MDVVKVLMADDEPEILELMAEKVVRSGYQVITAQDGEEAWEKIQKESPDVILLDLTMPKMDGFTVLQNLLQLLIRRTLHSNLFYFRSLSNSRHRKS